MPLPKGLSLIENDNQTLAKLYDTLIVVTKPTSTGHSITLKTGGWYTKHTKKCMNLALKSYGVQVLQRKGVWYAILPNGDKIEVQDNTTFQV